MRAMRAMFLFLAAALFAAALPVQAGVLEPILGIGLETEKPKFPPAIWAGITAKVGGREVASLTTDTPVSVIGLRGRPDLSYLFRVETCNLLHVEWVRIGINGSWEPLQKLGGAYETEIPSEVFRRGPNLLRLRVHGKFKTERLNLLLFRVSWRRSDELEGQLTMYMTDAGPGTDPLAFFASRGWVPIYDNAPPEVAEAEAAPAVEYAPPPPPPAPSPVSASAETEPAGATAVTPSSPVRFFWAGEEIAGGRLKIRAGTELTLRITCPSGTTQLRLERPGNKKIWEDQIDVDPPLLLNLGRIPAGESRLTIGTSAGTFELLIIGGEK